MIPLLSNYMYMYLPTMSIERMRNMWRTTNLVRCFPEVSRYQTPADSDISPNPRVVGSGLISRFCGNSDAFSDSSSSLLTSPWIFFTSFPELSSAMEDEGSYQDGSGNRPVELMPYLEEKLPESLLVAATCFRLFDGNWSSEAMLWWLPAGLVSMRGDERYGDEVAFFERRRLDRVIKTIAKVHIVVIRKQKISTVRERINYMRNITRVNRSCLAQIHYCNIRMHSPALHRIKTRHQLVPDGDETARQHICSPAAEWW